jgi:hypothetical protein
VVEGLVCKTGWCGVIAAAPHPRDLVSCRSCGAALGHLNRGDRLAVRTQVSRLVTPGPGVRVFVDLLMGRAEFFCPACGACGRTMTADRLRGIVLGAAGETETLPC